MILIFNTYLQFLILIYKEKAKSKWMKTELQIWNHQKIFFEETRIHRRNFEEQDRLSQLSRRLN